MATVSIIKATYSDPEIETLLSPFGGMEQFVKKNEKVLLLRINAQLVGNAKTFVLKAQLG